LLRSGVRGKRRTQGREGAAHRLLPGGGKRKKVSFYLTKSEDIEKDLQTFSDEEGGAAPLSTMRRQGEKTFEEEVLLDSFFKN